MVSDVHRTILYGGIFLSGLEPASASTYRPQSIGILSLPVSPASLCLLPSIPCAVSIAA